MPAETYDVVIIGGGKAGLVLANRLSENPELHVVVLETGQNHAGDKSILTPCPWSLQILSNAEPSWDFDTVQQEGLGGRSLDWADPAQSTTSSSAQLRRQM